MNLLAGGDPRETQLMIRANLPSRRALVFTVALALVATGVGVTRTTTPAAAACGTPTATTTAIFNLTNVARAGARVRALRWNGTLACLAANWSAYMSRTKVLQHRNLAKTIRQPPYNAFRTLGENILRGPKTMTPAAMHAAWMASPGHRANIVAAKYAWLGVGLTYSAGQVWAVQNFGG
jgi:uncharacterized protein YkwD